MTEDQEIEFIIDEDEKDLNMYVHIINNLYIEYFVGYEITELLGYKNPSKTINDNISKCNQLIFKDYPGIKEPCLDPRVILITREGVSEILKKTRKRVSDEVLNILKKFNIDTTKCKISKKNEPTLSSEIKIQNEQEVEFIIEEDENDLTTYSYISKYLCFEYFVGYEIASLLGYKNPAQTILNNVSKCNQLEFRDYPGIKEPALNPKTILITSDGAIEILLKTRKRISPDVLHILKKFNIDTTNRKCLTKEQQTLSSITDVFKTEKFEDQFKIGSYYLDLYFSEHKIVIECDENGHADRKPYKERERMDYVNETLQIDDSHWIRFNPDEHDFDITRVIGQIYRKIDEIKQYEYLKIEEENKKKYEEEIRKIEGNKIVEKKKKELFRKCKKCKLKKELTLEFFSFTGTGFSISCKECCYQSGAGNEKPVKQYDVEGKFIRRYNSAKEAAEMNNLKPNNIGRCCRGVVKISGNYIWTFDNDVKDDKSVYIVEQILSSNEEETIVEDLLNSVENEINVEEVNKRKNSVIKTVAQYNTDGTFIRTYESGHEAAKAIGVIPESIYSSIRNNFVSKGFLWKYVIDGIIIPKIPEVTPHKKYMKQVEIYKDEKLYKSFISIREAATNMNVNISMCRKFLAGIKKDPSNYEWKFKHIKVI